MTDFCERRQDGDVCDQIKKLEDRQASYSAQMLLLELKLDSNNKATTEILEIISMGKSFFKVIGHFGSFIKWYAAILAPIIAIYYTMKGGSGVH